MLDCVQSHFNKQLENGLSVYSPSAPNMWMASLDTRTGKYPENDERSPDIPRRHYRAIDAPRGCSIYWDMPAIVAAHSLSKIRGNKKYADASDSYVNDFLCHCIANNGIFLWGNHYYWDAFDGKVKKFVGEETPRPVDWETELGEYHETRPLPPAWDLFWRISPGKTERGTRAFAGNSVFDEKSGGFNRHADRRRGCAFLEAGGIIVESLAWLFQKNGDMTLVDDAQRCLDFSFNHRSEKTGLLENNPTGDGRWDKYACTTEIGLWAGSILRAMRNFEGKAKWLDKAAQAMHPYLDYGYDHEKRAYYGRLQVSDATPIIGMTEPDEMLRKHQPGDYADIWRPLFPAHDYPMPFAEACLELYCHTKDEAFRTASERWAEIIISNMPARNGLGAYAEHYGRCVHFLWRCGKLLSNDLYSQSASELAKEAIDVLFDNGMFRGHPGEHRYDAVDGVGFLLLALMALGTDEEPEMLGMGW